PVPANSDYFPFLDLNSGRARFRGQSAVLFTSWAALPLPLLEMLDVAPVRYGAITANDQFERARLVGVARDNLAVLTAGARSEERLAPRKDLASLSWLVALRATCGKGYEAVWTDALHAVARDSLAYLDAAAGAELIAAAAPTACR